MIHAVLLTIILSSASGTLVSGATADNAGPVMTVSLITLPNPTASAPAAPSSPLSVLAARLETGERPIAVMPASPHGSASLQALVKRLAAQQPTTRSAATPGRQSAATAPARAEVADEAATSPNRGQVAAGQAVGGSATGGLWGQIEPCWRNLGRPAAVAVSLEVTLDGAGELAKPPTILRGNAALDERRLTAEASALQALGACLPRGDLRFGGRAYRLEFPAS